MGQRDLLRLVLANLNRMRARVILTAIGVTIGTAAVVVLVSLGLGLQESFMGSVAQFGAVTHVQVSRGVPFAPRDPAAENKVDPLDDDVLRTIGGLEHVEGVTPQTSLNGGATMRYAGGDYYGNLQGLDPDVAPAMGWQVASGVGRLGRGLVVVGSGVFEQGAASDAPVRAVPTPEPADLVGKTIMLRLEKVDEEGEPVVRTERLRVAGVLEPGGGSDDYSVYVDDHDIAAYNRWFTGQGASPRDGYDQVLVIVDDAANVAAVQEGIHELGYQTFSALDVLKALNQLSWIIQGILGGLGAVALIVAAFGIANTMTMAIYERTREIGIMKALGATNRDVLRIFLSEAGAIGVIGGLLGAMVGWMAGMAVNLIVQNLLVRNAGGTLAADDLPNIAVTTWWLLAFAVAFAALIGLLSGVYPALRAASMKPLAALRAE